MIENSKCVCEHRRHDHLQDGSDYYGCFACACLSFRLTQPLKDEINYLQAISGHCFICHATWKGPKSPCDLERHMQQAATMCGSKCPEEYSKENPYNTMNQPSDPKLSIVEEFFKKHDWLLDFDEDSFPGDDIKLRKRNAYADKQVISDFLLAALEAHGKAEYERGRKEEADHYKLFPQNPYHDAELAHAAGFTEGVEKAIEAVSDINKRDMFGTPGIVPEEVMEFRKVAIDALEALKSKQ